MKENKILPTAVQKPVSGRIDTLKPEYLILKAEIYDLLFDGFKNTRTTSLVLNDITSILSKLGVSKIFAGQFFVERQSLEIFNKADCNDICQSIKNILETDLALLLAQRYTLNKINTESLCYTVITTSNISETQGTVTFILPSSVLPETLDFLKEMAEKIYLVFEKEEKFIGTQRLANYETLMRRVVTNIRNSIDLKEMKRSIVTEVGRMFNASRCFIVEFDEETRMFSIPDEHSEYLASEAELSLRLINATDKSRHFWGDLAFEKKEQPISHDMEEFIRQNNLENSPTHLYLKKFNIKANIGIPILYQGKVLGTLVLHFSKKLEPYKQEELSLLYKIADQIAVGLYQSQLYTKAKKLADREQHLRKISETVRNTLDPNEVFHRVCKEVIDIFDVDKVVVVRGTEKLHCRRWYSLCEYSKSDEFPVLVGIDPPDEVKLHLHEQIFTLNQNIVINDMSLYNKNDIFREAHLGANIRSLLSVGIKNKNNTYGMLGLVNFGKTKSWTTEEVELMELIANQLYFAANQAETFQNARKQAERESFLRDIASNIRELSSKNDIKSFFVNEVGKLFGASRCFIREFDNISQTPLDIEDCAEYLSSQNETSIIPVNLEAEDLQLIIESIKGQKEVFFSDRQKYIDENGLKDTPIENLLNKFGINSLIDMPIISSGYFWGNLVIQFSNEYVVFNEDDIAFARTIAYQIASAFHQADMEEKRLKKEHEEQTLNSFITNVRKSLDLKTVKRFLVAEIGKIFNADRCFICLYDEESESFIQPDTDCEYLRNDKLRSITDFDITSGDFNNFLSQILSNSTEIVMCNQADIIAEYSNVSQRLIEFATEFNIQSGFDIPIFYSERPLARLILHYNTPNAINKKDLKFLRKLGYYAGITLYQSILFEKNQKQARTENLLRKIISLIHSSLDINEVLKIICDEVGSLFNVQRAAIVEFSNPQNYKKYKVRRDYKSRPDIKGLGDINVPDMEILEYWATQVLGNDSQFTIDNIEAAEIPEHVKEFYRKTNGKSIMGSAIKNGNDKWGTIAIISTDEIRQWTPDEVKLMSTIADQIYLAIKQAELFSTTKKQAEREALLRNITEIIRSSLDINETLKIICSQVGKLFNVERCTITKCLVQDIDRYSGIVEGEFKSRENIAGLMEARPNISVDNYWNKHILGNHLTLKIDNIHTSDIPEYFREFYARLNVKSLLGVPIRKGNEAWGLITIVTTDAYREWPDEDVELLETISAHIYIAIKQAELYSRTKKLAENEKLIRNISNAVISNLTIEEVTKSIVTQIGKLLKTKRCFILAYDEKLTYKLKFDRYSEYLANPETKSMIELDLKEFYHSHFFHKLCIERKEVIVNDYNEYIQNENLTGSSAAEMLNSFGIFSGTALPIIYRGEIKGIFITHYSQSKNINEDDLNLLRMLVYQIGIVLHQSNLFEQSRKRAERENLLRNIIVAMRSTLNIKEVTKSIVTEIGRTFNSDRCFLRFLDLKRNIALTPEEFQEYRASEEICSLLSIDENSSALEDLSNMAYKQGLLTIEDTHEFIRENNLYGTPLEAYFNELNIKSDYAIPISITEDKYILLIFHFTKEIVRFDEEEKEFFKTLAHQAGIALEQAGLYRDQQKLAEKDKLLMNISNTIRNSLDINEVLDLICQKMCETFSIQKVFIFGDDDIAVSSRLFSVEHNSSSGNTEQIILNNGKKIQEFWRNSVKSNKEVYIINQQNADEEPELLVEMFVNSSAKSLIAVPVKKFDDIWGWLVLVQTCCSRDWSQEEISLLKSVTDQVYLAVKQASIYSQSQKTNELKSELLANVSHEFRTPLNAIIGFSNMLLTGNYGNLTDKQSNYINNISLSGSHLLKLVNNILDLSSVESGNMKLCQEVFETGCIIEETISILETMAHSKEITIKSSVARVKVYADMLRFRQIIYNLISNSIKFTENGGHIHVKSELRGKNLYVEIDDNGIGIPERYKNIIFTKFKQIDSSYSRKHEGTGLGLALTKKIVELQGGKIDFISKEKGSTFWFIIPINI